METNSISSLKAVDVSTILNTTTIYVKGYFNPGDGGGGIFIYSSSGTEVDHGGIFIEPSIGSGVWIRIYDGSNSIRWFGAMGNESNPEHTYINNAINYVYNTFGYGEVIFPPAWYKLEGDLITYSSVTLRGVGNPYLFRKGTFSSETYFITINGCSDPANWMHSKVAIEGIIFSGDESFDGTPPISYKANLIALRIYANSFHIKNCAFFGFDKTTKFESNSYVVSFNGCSFRQNNYGFHYEFTNAMNNSGENIRILDSVIGGNNYGIFNKWGGLFINNCSVDYNIVHIADVQSKNGGVIVLPTFIDNCHFESLSSTSSLNYRINVSSSGVLFIKHCFFSDDSNRLFNIDGQLVLTDNSFLSGDGKYLVNGTGITIETNNLPPANDQIARINTLNSNIRNGSFEHDLMEGWEFSAGLNAETSYSNTYDSSKALKIYPTDIYTGTHLISDFIAIPTNRLGYILSVYVTNSNHAGAIHVKYYNGSKTFLNEVTQATGFTSIPAKIKFQYFFPEKAVFMRIEIRCPNGDSTTKAIYLDDFYLSFLLVP